ncbi:hypothetical protein ACSLBF_07325 [Pseudoalteromonas sp. T1lg65]|uniref:hypothetical protein n=1 Tax=Pseudoalteromonas sp. T1lg65 TaxID=2077101 RepID=UPI003F7A598A
MKTLVSILIIMFSPLVLANPLLGSWEFVSGEYATEGGVVSAKAPQVTSIKLITKTHHSYITQAAGKFKYAGGGSYHLDGNKFVETYEYGNVDSLLGRTMAFTYKVEGNLWHHELYENGKFVEKEIWRKVK